MTNLRGLLHAHAEIAKPAILKHIKQLTLTPKRLPSGYAVYEVNGSLELAPQDDVMPVVARDGIEPPTPAFSGLLTDSAKWFRFSTGDSWKRSFERAVLGLIGMI